MHKFNFDEIVNRHNTDSIKWDAYPKESIPLWVADMDFKSPPCISKSLQERIKHEIFGYTHEPKSFKQNISNYLSEQYQWDVHPDWIVIVPSVVSSLYSIGVNCTDESSHIITPKPVYQHLRIAANNSERSFDEAQLESIDNRLVLTAKSLTKVMQKNTDLLYFCNPQNPGGTVYRRDELQNIVDISLKNNLIICSDEIHAGLVLDDIPHIPIASISEAAANNTITLMSLNKTFNFPGVGLAWVVCKNKNLREKIKIGIGSLIPETQIFGYIATQAVIEHGEEWRIALLSYLRNNRQLLIEEIDSIPGLNMYAMEASYLGWISCQKISHEDPFKLFLKYGVALQPGTMFNEDGHVRINIATPRDNLIKALSRIRRAVKESGIKHD
jgi:aminotransferase/cystathionine beta-lyase